MYFEEDYVYHVYNRGNNKQRIFLEEDNYQFFLKKIEEYILPHASLLAYCLMPNHFHILLQAKSISQAQPASKTFGRTALSGQTVIHPLNRKIGTLLSSYTQAINKRHRRTGSLFQQKTKAKQINFSRSKVDYAFTCFQYIHRNPMDAGLVRKMEDWEYSSFREYINDANDGICNQELAEELINFDSDNFYLESYQAEDEIKMLYL